jgi:hypothetical protein
LPSNTWALVLYYRRFGNKGTTSSRGKILEMKRFGPEKEKKNSIFLSHIQKICVLGVHSKRMPSLQQEYVNIKLMEPSDSTKLDC